MPKSGYFCSPTSLYRYMGEKHVENFRSDYRPQPRQTKAVFFPFSANFEVFDKHSCRYAPELSVPRHTNLAANRP